MIQPDDDFENDFEDGDPEFDATEMMEARPVKVDLKNHQDTRRKIEDILEARRLKEELGELEL